MEKQLGRLDQKLTSVDMRGRDTNNRRVFVFVDAARFCPENATKYQGLVKIAPNAYGAKVLGPMKCRAHHSASKPVVKWPAQASPHPPPFAPKFHTIHDYSPCFGSRKNNFSYLLRPFVTFGLPPVMFPRCLGWVAVIGSDAKQGKEPAS